ncbi:MAG: autotransporter assembly complex protein TamA [Pseudomonadota bacterium]
MLPTGALIRRLLLTTCLLACGTQAAEVRTEGIDGELRRNVIAYIGPEEETGRMSYRALARHAEEQARAALQALGYYHPVITVSREGREDKPVCVLRIEAGPPVLVRDVQVLLEGDRDPRELGEFVALNRAHRGDVFHHGKYESFKTRLLQQALMLGYFDAAWTRQQVRLDTDSNTADIELSMALGARYKVGQTTIHGEGFEEGLIARFPRFRAGDWYDAGKMAELHRDLVRTGWFENVRIRAEPSDAVDLAVPVDIEYEPRKKNRIGIGAGFSTDIGPRVQLQWEKPWLNARGHSLASYLEMSEVRSQFEASYLVPLSDPVTSQLAYSYGVQMENLNDHDYWLTTAGIEHRKRLPSKWRLIRALDIERETDDFGEREISSTLLIPGVTFSRTDSDGVPLVTRGWRAIAHVQFASRDLLSDADMLRGTLDAKVIHSLGERVRVIARGGVGAMATDDILDIPVSLRFYAGGDQSVRGYKYESIAPEDINGDLVGGRYRAETSIEFDWRFAERWLVAVFADRGTAFDDVSESDFVTGAGAGIRWLSPIGPLRLDFARGISEDDPPFNVHFYMGPEL